MGPAPEASSHRSGQAPSSPAGPPAGEGGACAVLDGFGLDADAVALLADGAAVPVVAPEAYARAERSWRTARRLAESGRMYGRDTGVGANRMVFLSDEDKVEQDLRLLRSHAGGIGALLPAREVRAMLAVRANQVLAGGSGLQPAFVHAMIEALRLHVHPAVNEYGAVGTGDLTALAQTGLTLIGERPWLAGPAGPRGPDLDPVHDTPADRPPAPPPVRHPTTEPAAGAGTEPPVERAAGAGTGSAVEPVAQVVSGPVTEPAVEPVAEPVSGPVTERAAGWASGAATGSAVEPVVEVVFGPVTEPAVERAAGAATGVAVERVAEVATRPATEPAVEPAAGRASVSAADRVAGPTAQRPAGPAADRVAGPTAERPAGPATGPATERVAGSAVGARRGAGGGARPDRGHPVTAAAMAAVGVRGPAPVALTRGDGLALMSSNALTLGQAALVCHDIDVLLRASHAVAALSLAAVGGSLEAYAAPVHALRPYPGTLRAAAEVRRLLGQPDRPRVPGRRIQDPYGFRAFPQVHGPALEAVAALRRVLSVEINCPSENPLITEDGGADGGPAVYHHGGFFAAPLGLALDQLCLAVLQTARLSAARLAHLGDPGITGLRPFLAGDTAAGSGIMILEYSANSALAELRAAASAPASAGHTVLSHGLEEAASFASQAARQALRAAGAYRLVLACELVAAVRALRERPASALPPDAPAFTVLSTPTLPAATEDRPLTPDVTAATLLLPALATL